MPVIELDHVTKIEGHAKLNLSIESGKLKNLELEINEGARFFEDILKGKKYNELPSIAARICGVCSPSHTLASLQAIEEAFSVSTSRNTKLLRELLAIGGMIQSHVLHLYFLVLPDYIGFGSALQMAEKRRGDIHRALRIKRLGNRIVRLVGGRDIHPLTAIAGGFSKVPSADDLKALLDELEEAEDDASRTLELFCGLPLPDFQHETPYMALRGRRLQGGKISSLRSGQLDHLPHDYEKYIKEYLQHDSTGEFVVVEGKAYAVGSQARISVNWDLQDKDLRRRLPIKAPAHSPFYNSVFQSFEIVTGLKRAAKVVSQLIEAPVRAEKSKKVKPRASTGIGAVEAPRGLLFHKYSFDDDGYCTYANVTTPTSQNLRSIEACLRTFVRAHLHLPEEELVLETEKLIRAFDPCISCSSH